MSMRTIVAGLVVSGLAAAGCASSSDNEISDAACSTDERSIAIALEAHLAMNGAHATTLDDLFDLLGEDRADKWMLARDPSDTWLLEPAAEGADATPLIVAVPGGHCDL